MPILLGTSGLFPEGARIVTLADANASRNVAGFLRVFNSLIDDIQLAYRYAL